jgi:hypothetical protein
MPSDAVWVMKYDDKLDGEVNAKLGRDIRWRIAMRNDRVAGCLADLKEGDPQDHKLAGEVATGKSPIVHIRQDGPGGLTCYYTGKFVGADRVVGTWFDNRGGSGDFEMSVEKK